jgi:hypothetical protein
MGENLILKSQFRCNGSDAYIQLINKMLQIDEYVDIDLSKLEYDIKVFDNPIEMKNELRKINESDKN